MQAFQLLGHSSTNSSEDLARVLTERLQSEFSAEAGSTPLAIISCCELIKLFLDRHDQKPSLIADGILSTASEHVLNHGGVTRSMLEILFQVLDPSDGVRLSNLVIDRCLEESSVEEDTILSGKQNHFDPEEWRFAEGLERPDEQQTSTQTSARGHALEVASESFTADPRCKSPAFRTAVAFIHRNMNAIGAVTSLENFIYVEDVLGLLNKLSTPPFDQLEHNLRGFMDSFATLASSVIDYAKASCVSIAQDNDNPNTVTTLLQNVRKILEALRTMEPFSVDW